MDLHTEPSVSSSCPQQEGWDLMAPSFVTGAFLPVQKAEIRAKRFLWSLLGMMAQPQPFPSPLLSCSSTDLVTVALSAWGHRAGTSHSTEIHGEKNPLFLLPAPSHAESQGAWLFPESPTKIQQSAEKNLHFDPKPRCPG